MLATIQRWGNSQGIRVPKTMLDDLGMSVNDRVELVPSADGLVVRKATTHKHRTLKERFESFYGKPLEEIPPIDWEPEIDWGPSVGEEIW